MVLSCEFTEKINDCGGVLDLTGLALNANANTLADVLSTKPVTHLVLADCMLEQTAANRLLESLNGLVALDLRGNDLRGKSVSILASVVRKCNLLHSLNLEWNSIGQCDQEFHELCNAVASNRNLVRLDLRNNQLTNGHGLHLAQLLVTNSPLKVLDLRWNRIGSTAGREIVEALKHNSTVEDLLLEGNGLSRELVESIKLICERNMRHHQTISKNKQETSFLLQQLDETKTFALGETIKLEGRLECGRREKVELESNLWTSKEVLVELRSKLEITESKLAERDAQLSNLNDELKIYKQESREIASKLQIEIDSVKIRKNLDDKTFADERQTLNKKILSLQSSAEASERDGRSFKAEIENLNKNMDSERRNIQETRENEELHFQRNLNRLNEQLERERNAKRAQEEENSRLREQLAELTRNSREQEEKHLSLRREFERELKQKKEESIQDIQNRLDTERNLRVESERTAHTTRTTMEDTHLRLTNMEESRDRLTNQLRALEISIEPTKQQLENVMKENLSRKEEHLTTTTNLRTEITNLRDELQRANSKLKDHESRQKQREEMLRGALTQYFQ